MVPTLQEVDAIQKGELESGQVVAIGYQYNYSPRTAEIKKRLLAGEIGEIERIDCIALWPRDFGYYHRNNWAGCLHDGNGWVLDSPLHNALSHLVNLILFFAGKEPEASADLYSVKAELYRAKRIQNYDTVRTEAMLDNDVPAAIVLSHSSCGRLDPEIHIQGSRGKLVWRFGGTHSIETAEGVEYLVPESPLEVRACMFENVVRRIQGDASVLVCTTELARGEVKWINAVQDAVAVREVPSQYRRQITSERGEIFDVIEDLDYYAIRVFKERCWFSDLGAPWADEPGSLDLEGYSSFKGHFVTIPAMT
jgi:predicted dehydrogenase